MNVLVFGATGGLGSAVARALASRGDRLVLAARGAPRLEALSVELGVHGVLADATRPMDVNRAVQAATDALGELDGVACLVGGPLVLRPAHLTLDAQWREVLTRQLDTAFYVLRAAVGALRERGGSVVLTSSYAGEIGLPNHDALAAAAGAVGGLVRGAAATYARDRIRVNAVAPGVVRSPASVALISEPGAEAAARAVHPLGRLGQPSDVAGAFAWLLSPDSAWVTGQVLGVDGGLTRTRAMAPEPDTP